jgi:hypothetical protein
MPRFDLFLFYFAVNILKRDDFIFYFKYGVGTHVNGKKFGFTINHCFDKFSSGVTYLTELFCKGGVMLLNKFPVSDSLNME